MKSFVFLLLLWPLADASSAPKRKTEPEVHVDVNTNAYPLEKFKNVPGVKAKPMHPETAASSEDEVPEREAREKVFAKVRGLEKQIKDYDELDRDLLFLRARNAKNAADLAKKYPTIERKLLTRLIKVVKK